MQEQSAKRCWKYCHHLSPFFDIQIAHQTTHSNSAHMTTSTQLHHKPNRKIIELRTRLPTLQQRKTTTKTAILQGQGYLEERMENQKLAQNTWSRRNEGRCRYLVLLFIFEQEQSEMVSKANNDIQRKLQKKRRLIHGIHDQILNRKKPIMIFSFLNYVC